MPSKTPRSRQIMLNKEVLQLEMKLVTSLPATQCLQEGNEVEFCSILIYLMLVSPRAKRLTGFSSVSVFVR